MLNQVGRQQQQQHGEKEALNSWDGGSGGGSTASQLSYPKTKSQATTSGQDYEVALCSLFFLRALRVSSDFFLAGNYEPAGKFDDVVLFYRLKEDSDPAVYRAIFLQAKHKDNTQSKTLTFSQLQGYLQSFTKIKNLWEQLLVIDGRQITIKEVFLIHYTNTGCAVDTVASEVDDLPGLQKFLNTGGRLMRIREVPEELSEGQDTSDFLGKLLLCTQQMSVKTTDIFLLDEMCKLLGLGSRDVGSELTSKLKSVVKAWWSTRGRGNFLTANSEEWKRILQMQVTRLNSDTSVVDSRMTLCFTEEALKQLDVVRRHMKMTWIRVSDMHQASMTRVRFLRARSKSLVLGAEYLDSHWAEVEALWGKSVYQTLVLDLTDNPRWEESQLLERLQEAVEMDARRHLVVVATEQPHSEGWNVVEPLETWSALDTPTQQRLLSVKVELQGIANVALRDFVGFSLSCVMTDEVIKSLSVSKPAIRLGEAMTTPLDYYVPRCLQRISSKKITYLTLENTNTLIFSSNHWGYSFPLDVKVKTLWRVDLEKTNKIERLILVPGNASNSEIRIMCSKFHVKGFKGWAEREGLTGEVTEFIPLTWICEDDVVVVEGLPGVGKSSFVTQMCSVAKKEFPECWVLRVDMARHTEYLKGVDFTCTSDVMKFLFKAHPKNSLERHLLEHALRVTGNVFLFLDAFDEISPDYTAQCCRLLKGIAKGVRYRKMVVTTRPVTTKDVEEALQTKAFTLPVFSQEEQTSFFTKFSVASGKAVDKKAITSFQQIAGDVIEIPLLCKMSADVLMNSQDDSIFQYNDPWRRILLYQLFVEQTVKNRFAEKFGLEISNPAFRNLLESNRTHHLHNLQGWAVRKLMPNTELSSPYDGVPQEKFGLVVDTGGSVDFEHRTFAEFFLGCWLSDNWRHCRRKHLRRLLLQDGFQFVVSTLSWSLFQGFLLHLAVAGGDAEAVREELLVSSAGTTDRGGRSALHVAAMTPGCSREILELLVASGGDLNREDAILAIPAVRYAEVARNWDFLDVMAGKGARLENLNFLNNHKAAKEVLIQAIQRDLADFTNCVLKLNKQLLRLRVGDDRNTLLHIAALNNSTLVLDVLIQSGFEKNVQNRSGETALHLAAYRGLLAVTELLIMRGAEAEVKDNNGGTAIMWAARGGNLKIVKFLIERGVDTNVKNNNGDTMLMWAVRGRNLEIVKFLIESGVDAEVKNNYGNTAIMWAAGEGNSEIVKFLIESGVDAEVKNNNGDTLILWAAKGENLRIVKFLIETGVDAEVKNNYGNTAIMWAARRGNLEIVKFLIESGVDANVKNSNGDTLLMCAARGGNLEIVKFLIERGVDANVKNNNGDTLLIWAARRGNLEIVKFLIERGVDAKVKNNNGDTLLMWAAWGGNLEIVKFLIESGVDANVKNNNGDTLLMWAAWGGNLEIVKFLIESGVDAKVKNNNGDTLLMWAA